LWTYVASDKFHYSDGTRARSHLATVRDVIVTSSTSGTQRSSSHVQAVTSPIVSSRHLIRLKLLNNARGFATSTCNETRSFERLVTHLYDSAQNAPFNDKRRTLDFRNKFMNHWLISVIFAENQMKKIAKKTHRPTEFPVTSIFWTLTCDMHK